MWRSISIDEKGCEAAAYTHIVKGGAAPPEDEIVMKLDRPFIFAITGGAGDAPLFIGVVNNPVKHRGQPEGLASMFYNSRTTWKLDRSLGYSRAPSAS
ncbi:MAG: serpin family protein [Bacillota bacterium]|jgi:hypothetical protein